MENALKKAFEILRKPTTSQEDSPKMSQEAVFLFLMTMKSVTLGNVGPTAYKTAVHSNSKLFPKKQSRS